MLDQSVAVTFPNQKFSRFRSMFFDVITHSHVVPWPTKADDISKMYVCTWLAVALQQNSKKLKL